MRSGISWEAWRFKCCSSLSFSVKPYFDTKRKKATFFSSSSTILAQSSNQILPDCRGCNDNVPFSWACKRVFRRTPLRVQVRTKDVWIRSKVCLCRCLLSMRDGLTPDSSIPGKDNLTFRSLSFDFTSYLYILLDSIPTWFACKSLANGFSFSWRVNETMKFNPSFDLREIVGLTSSAEDETGKKCRQVSIFDFFSFKKKLLSHLLKAQFSVGCHLDAWPDPEACLLGMPWEGSRSLWPWWDPVTSGASRQSCYRCFQFEVHPRMIFGRNLTIHFIVWVNEEKNRFSIYL